MIEKLVRLMSNAKGQSLIEFALVAPILLVFLLAIVDFGIAIDRRAHLKRVASSATLAAVNRVIRQTLSAERVVKVEAGAVESN